MFLLIFLIHERSQTIETGFDLHDFIRQRLKTFFYLGALIGGSGDIRLHGVFLRS